MSKECKKNKYLNTILDNRKPSKGTLTNFMNDSDVDVTHKNFYINISHA